MAKAKVKEPSIQPVKLKATNQKWIDKIDTVLQTGDETEYKRLRAYYSYEIKKAQTSGNQTAADMLTTAKNELKRAVKEARTLNKAKVDYMNKRDSGYYRDRGIPIPSPDQYQMSKEDRYQMTRTARRLLENRIGPGNYNTVLAQQGRYNINQDTLDVLLNRLGRNVKQDYYLNTMFELMDRFGIDLRIDGGYRDRPSDAVFEEIAERIDMAEETISDMLQSGAMDRDELERYADYLEYLGISDLLEDDDDDE